MPEKVSGFFALKRVSRMNEMGKEYELVKDFTIPVGITNKDLEIEDAYAGLLYVYEHADELNVDKDNIILEGESAGGEPPRRKQDYSILQQVVHQSSHDNTSYHLP